MLLLATMEITTEDNFIESIDILISGLLCTLHKEIQNRVTINTHPYILTWNETNYINNL